VLVVAVFSIFFVVWKERERSCEEKEEVRVTGAIPWQVPGSCQSTYLHCIAFTLCYKVVKKQNKN